MLRKIIYLPFCEWLIEKLKFYNPATYDHFMDVKASLQNFDGHGFDDVYLLNVMTSFV